MDPVSHVIFGRTIVAALERPDRGRFGSGAAAAAMLGALSPDIDSVFMPAGWDRYLRVHEIGTHSLLGALVVGSAAAVLVRLVARRARFPALAAAGMLGALSHLLFDLLSGARLHLFWPLAEVRVTWPLVAMADPWLIAVLTISALWLIVKRRHLSKAAAQALALVAVFFVVKSLLYIRVLDLVRQDPATAADLSAIRLKPDATDNISPGSAIAFEARWASWTEWFVYVKEAERLRIWRADALRGSLEPTLLWTTAGDAPLTLASRRLDTVRNFLAVHDLTFAVEQPTGEGTEVLWSDIRYCWQEEGARISCGLWFGGLYGPDGRPIRQVVKLGEWLQTRPLP